MICTCATRSLGLVFFSGFIFLIVPDDIHPFLVCIIVFNCPGYIDHNRLYRFYCIYNYHQEVATETARSERCHSKRPTRLSEGKKGPAVGLCSSL
ncbi:hypothetical protein C8J55DRAFT_103056 [Lentinula edodes]|uniref:Uncharacterized protein n=1 Tax=Lentinula lateritia TaxID=40482 RepID=A0A9W9B055_9AGAR|nr:hypothetical protein C8J55DRAFT_103056 [Lentinula edodes]